MLRTLATTLLLLGLCAGLGSGPARAEDQQGDKTEKKQARADKEKSQTCEPRRPDGDKKDRWSGRAPWIPRYHRHAPPWARGHHAHRPGFGRPHWHGYDHHWGGWQRWRAHPGQWQGRGMPYRKHDFRRPSPDELFGRFDADKDGSLSKQEFAEGLKKMRERFHKRMHVGDRRPGYGPPRHGFAQGPQRGPAGRPGATPPEAVDLLKRFDDNTDGKLVKDEVPAGLWDRLSKADGDKDGAVTKEELQAAREKMRERFQQMKQRAAAERKAPRSEPDKQ